MLIMGKLVGSGSWTQRFRHYEKLSPLTGALALIILSGFYPSSSAYVLEGPRWPSGSVVTFELALGPASRTLLDGNTSWNTAAAPAAVAWDNVMGNLTFLTSAQTTTAVSGDGRNTINFSSTVFGDSFGSGTLAVTTYLSSGSTMNEADVLFNNHQTFDSYRGPLRYDNSGHSVGDIRRVLVHELGHALGLDHPDDHGQHVIAIMNSRTSDVELPTSDDIAGAQFLYGVPAPAATTTPLDDFNSDADPDLLLYNVSTRQTAIWFLNNNAFNSGALGPSLPSGWKVAGVADFDGDGQLDYLLFNSSTRQSVIWYLSGSTLVSGNYGPTIANGYVLAGVADFNRDGKPDYLLYNSATRQTVIWYMSNNVFVSGAYGPSLPAGWRVAGVADFDGDGKLDYLLFNSGTRQSAIWYLSGVNYTGGVLGPTIASGYVLAGAADFDGDGKPDYLLYNPSSRQTAIWYLNNSLLTGGAYGPALPGGWSLAGP